MNQKRNDLYIFKFFITMAEYMDLSERGSCTKQIAST